jgi:hypothetical protein
MDRQNDSVDMVVRGEGAITVKATAYNPDKIEYLAELYGHTVRVKADISSAFVSVATW